MKYPRSGDIPQIMAILKSSKSKKKKAKKKPSKAKVRKKPVRKQIKDLLEKLEDPLSQALGEQILKRAQEVRKSLASDKSLKAKAYDVLTTVKPSFKKKKKASKKKLKKKTTKKSIEKLKKRAKKVSTTKKKSTTTRAKKKS